MVQPEMEASTTREHKALIAAIHGHSSQQKNIHPNISIV